MRDAWGCTDTPPTHWGRTSLLLLRGTQNPSYVTAAAAATGPKIQYEFCILKASTRETAKGPAAHTMRAAS